ncbi:hypothetical protein [Ktedonobacter racemifer]|uniref:Uncharacterized protein n=1 Tax=Ktedonobacter racemifer DSM 44963 TaxID=485913 RepID=D6TVF9_KTERA|nr:hypothetical protein [Ktedonobacter racemifer]EFH85362.1 conserved hypothetical protein [Ktedonobacter racemifer DSM 44963]
MESYSLEKRIWTQDDFEHMGWHDSTIHAMAFVLNEWDIGFDIDYLLQWINPTPPETHFSFWVAPATLIFHNVSDVKCDYDWSHATQLTLQGIKRSDKRQTPNGMSEWLWTLDGNEGTIQFFATGYTQYFRRSPLLQESQTLSLEKRGGISFEHTSENA